MIHYSLGAEALAHKNEIGNKAFNLAKVAEYIDKDIIANGFVIAAESFQNCRLEVIANEIYVECMKRNMSFPIILRSSANVEDSMYSFAGIFESYICDNDSDIYIGLKNVLLAKKAERMQVYSRRAQIDSNSVKLSIIVQTVVKADYAGVAFSKNPVTNDDSVIYMEYIVGNTSEVEEGLGNPITISISKKQEKLVIPEAEMIDIIKKYILKLEKGFGKEIDVEWAYLNLKGELKIFQVRPITT